MVRVRVGVTFAPVLECNGDGNLRLAIASVNLIFLHPFPSALVSGSVVRRSLEGLEVLTPRKHGETVF